MKLICDVHKDVENLLPHFLKYYKSKGISLFIFCVFNGESNPVWNRIVEICKEYGVDYRLELSYNSETINSSKAKEGYYRVSHKYLEKFEWSVVTDLDEFHDLEGFSNFQEMVKLCEEEGVDHIKSVMVDMVKDDYSIPLTIEKNIDIFEQFKLKIHLSPIIKPKACRFKVSLIRYPKLADEAGHHLCRIGKFLSKPGITYHFKWFGNIIDKEMEKYIGHKDHSWSYEFKTMADFIQKNNMSLKIQ